VALRTRSVAHRPTGCGKLAPPQPHLAGDCAGWAGRPPIFAFERSVVSIYCGQRPLAGDVSPPTSGTDFGAAGPPQTRPASTRPVATLPRVMSKAKGPPPSGTTAFQPYLDRLFLKGLTWGHNCRASELGGIPKETDPTTSVPRGGERGCEAALSSLPWGPPKPILCLPSNPFRAGQICPTGLGSSVAGWPRLPTCSAPPKTREARGGSPPPPVRDGTGS
jgi:hypothetical protein